MVCLRYLTILTKATVPSYTVRSRIHAYSASVRGHNVHGPVHCRVFAPCGRTLTSPTRIGFSGRTPGEESSRGIGRVNGSPPGSHYYGEGTRLPNDTVRSGMHVCPESAGGKNLWSGIPPVTHYSSHLIAEVGDTADRRHAPTRANSCLYVS